MTEPLLVYLHGEQIGEITRAGGGRLRYLRPDAAALSTSMPPSQSRHQWKTLRPWLEGLLPERPELLMRLRAQHGIRDQSPLTLISHLGEELAGAARFIRPERLDEALKPGQLTPLSEHDVAGRLRLARASQPADASGGESKFSLAGAQAKIALRADSDGQWYEPTGEMATTHIIKPVIFNMPDQELGEHLIMRTAQLLSLRCATSAVATFEDVPAIVVTRFDRVPVGSTMVRVHQEDFAQALGVLPMYKYERQGGPSARSIIKHLRAHVPNEHQDADVRSFVAALIFNWLILGTDAHAKNYSMLLEPGLVRLAPLYDLNSYLIAGGTPRAEMSMSIGGEHRADRIGRAHWTTLAADAGLNDEWVLDELARQIAQMPTAISQAIGEAGDIATSSDVVKRFVLGLASWTSTAAKRAFG